VVATDLRERPTSVIQNDFEIGSRSFIEPFHGNARDFVFDRKAEIDADEISALARMR
jgi:hypothetical protein